MAGPPGLLLTALFILWTPFIIWKRGFRAPAEIILMTSPILYLIISAPDSIPHGSA